MKSTNCVYGQQLLLHAFLYFVDFVIAAVCLAFSWHVNVNLRTDLFFFNSAAIEGGQFKL